VLKNIALNQFFLNVYFIHSCITVMYMYAHQLMLNNAKFDVLYI